jgi:hypothetical protein
MMLQARLDPSGGCGPVAPLNFWDVQREARGCSRLCAVKSDDFSALAA